MKLQWVRSKLRLVQPLMIAVGLTIAWGIPSLAELDHEGGCIVKCCCHEPGKTESGSHYKEWTAGVAGYKGHNCWGGVTRWDPMRNCGGNCSYRRGGYTHKVTSKYWPLVKVKVGASKVVSIDGITFGYTDEKRWENLTCNEPMPCTGGRCR